MKKLLALFILSVLLISCKTNTEKKTVDSKIYGVEEFLADAGELKDQDVSVSGMVVHVCKHGGQKMFIVGDNKDERLLIRTSANIAEFDVELEGSSVEVTGKVIATVTQEACSEEGEEHAKEAENEEQQGENEEPEDCEFEKSDSIEVVVYHIQASSFKEISE